MKMLNSAALAAASALAMLAASPALAHARLVSSNPADNAAVAAPRTIVLNFNERLVAAFTKVELTMPEHGGMKVAASSAPANDGKGLVVTPARPLGKGAYKLVWSTASADGHKMSGEISFTVR
jgi:hypothetical protein